MNKRIIIIVLCSIFFVQSGFASISSWFGNKNTTIDIQGAKELGIFFVGVCSMMYGVLLLVKEKKNKKRQADSILSSVEDAVVSVAKDVYKKITKDHSKKPFINKNMIHAVVTILFASSLFSYCFIIKIMKS